jgi:hypothetical protein
MWFDLLQTMAATVTCYNGELHVCFCRHWNHGRH